MNILKRFFGRSEERFAIMGGNNPAAMGFQPKAGWTASDYLPPTIGVFSNTGHNDSGVPVDEFTALTANAVYAAVNCISGTISTLPIKLQKSEDATPQPTHPVARLLCREPNEFMTASTFWTTIMSNALLWGHGSAYIEKDDMGVPISLYPLRSSVTRPIRMYGELLYVTLVGTTYSYLRPDQILSVVNLSVDGITPISPIQEAKQSIGLSLALERYAARFFSNGGNVGGILTLPPGLTEKAQENFLSSWRRNYTGAGNAHKVGVLKDGYKWTPTGTEPEKGQALQSRVNQLREVARIFRVPPHKLGDLERATFSNIEQLSIEYMQDCIQPWAVRIEQECERKLLLEREKGELCISFDLDSMLRADTAARYTAYQQGRQGGWLSINDCRRKEGLPPVANGDGLLSPLNMTEIGPAAGAKREPAARALLEDAARRCLTKESKALARAAKKHSGKPDELRAWATDWYATHQALVIRTMTPALKAAGSTADPAEYAATHCAESLRQISAAGPQTLDDISDEWADIRPAEIADQLSTKGML